MAAAPITFTRKGPRPLDLRRDVSQVLYLLNLVFGPTLDNMGRRLLNQETMLTEQPMFLAQLNLWAMNIPPGYVWEEKGRIVGNVSIIPTKIPGRYIIANVAVHPDHRRKGIARLLMQEVLKLLAGRNGYVVLLQVEQNNQQAIALYRSLGFVALGAITTWLMNSGHLRQLPISVSERSPDHFGDYLLRPLARDEWRQAWQLDQSGYPPDLYWPEPLAQQAYKTGLWRWLGNFMSGRQIETWVAANRANQLFGLASIISEWGRPHELTLRIAPAGRGQLERPLLAKLLRRLSYLAHRNVQIDHPAGDETINQLLQEANFAPRRTLMTMRFELNG